MKILKKLGAVALAAVTAVTALYSPISAKAESASIAALSVGEHYSYEGWGTNLFSMDFAGDSETPSGEWFPVS